MEKFLSISVLGREMAFIPEIISTLIIPVQKIRNQSIPYWARYEVNGLKNRKEKQGNVLSSAR